LRKKSANNTWKKTDIKRKKIIWAPHWTIKGYQNTGLDWSCFLDYADVFLNIAKEYKEKVQLAIKPHPFLKTILENEDLWGNKKTIEYFKKWDELENCQYVDGDYVDLFIHSDALIHDSGGFLAEYLIIDKPAAYTNNNRDIDNLYNSFAKQAFNCHTIVKNNNELYSFIEDVINERDEKRTIRNEFIKSCLIYNDMYASDNIINKITNEINK